MKLISGKSQHAAAALSRITVGHAKGNPTRNHEGAPSPSGHPLLSVPPSWRGSPDIHARRGRCSDERNHVVARSARTPHDDRISSGAHCGAHCGARSRGRDTGRNIGRDTNARGARGASTSSASTSSTATNGGACRWCRWCHGHADAISRSRACPPQRRRQCPSRLRSARSWCPSSLPS